MAPAFDDATFYAPAAQVEANLQAAKVGQRFVYATGPTLDPRHETVRVVKRWQEQGLALLNFARRDGKGQYLVTRCAAAQPERARRKPAPIDPEMLETVAGRLLRILRICADSGLPCPSDADLGAQLGLDRKAAGYQLSLLAAAGHVEVTNPAPRKRVVRIVATGRATVLA